MKNARFFCGSLSCPPSTKSRISHVQLPGTVRPYPLLNVILTLCQVKGITEPQARNEQVASYSDDL